MVAAYSWAATDPTKSTLQHVDLITTHATHPTTSTVRHVVTDIVEVCIDLELEMTAYSSCI